MDDLPSKLRRSISELHDRIERTDAAQAMISGTIPRRSYIALLGRMLAVHQALEAALDQAEGLGEVVDLDDVRRAEDLREDLSVLNGVRPLLRQGEDAGDDAPEATAFQKSAERWRKQGAWAIFGCLYVLEGSRMGSLALVGPLAKALGVRPALGVGLDYHMRNMADRPRRWQEFRRRISDAWASLPVEQQSTAELHAVAVAVEVMEFLCRLYASIDVSSSFPEDRTPSERSADDSSERSSDLMLASTTRS